MATETRSEALVAWLNAIEPAYDSEQLPLKTIEDCYDPLLLAAACQTVDPDFFGDVLGDEELLSSSERLDGLNRLIIAIEQYFHDTIGQKAWSMPVIDVHGIAQQDNKLALVSLLVIIISMAVLSPNKEEQIKKIQATPEWVQKELMLCIEEVRAEIPSPDPANDLASSAMAEESSDSLASYIDLHAAHRALKNTHASTQQELEALRIEHEELMRSLVEGNNAVQSEKRHAQGENDHRMEIERLQADLTKFEQVIAESEQTAAAQQKTIEALTKQVEELAPKAELADKLKDEVDEYRHTAEKSRKLEASVERYKKKLEEAAEAKRALKGLEEENVALLERNARLEEDFDSVSHLKDLNEQYKQTITELETRNRTAAQEKEALQLSLESDRQQILALTSEKNRQAEDAALLEERLKQLEGAPSGSRTRIGDGPAHPSGESTDDEDSINDMSGMANELDDATSGVTTTELKLQIRKLQRELDALLENKAESSRLLVLENLLDDAQKTKIRYEQEFLKEHKEKLVLERQMDEIRKGKSSTSHDSKATVALRIRLAETLEELDAVRKTSASLLENYSQAEKQLKLARADLSLVDKSQTTMLAEVRKSVAEEQTSTDSELKRLKEELEKAKQTNNMQLSQINSLLLDKVHLQSTGISQRDALLNKEGNSNTNAATDYSQVTALKSELEQVQESLDQTKDQLKKARHFIRQQDKLFKEQHQARANAANGDRQQEIETLRAELIKQKAMSTELEQKYQNEQRLLLVAYQEAGLDSLRSQVLANGQTPSRAPPVSWLAQQRARTLRYASVNPS